MKTKLIRLFFIICLLTVGLGAFSRMAQADEPIEAQANTKIFLPIVMKPTGGCQFSTLLQNGSFENGVSPWSQTSASNLPIIDQSNSAYDGLWWAWFGGYNNGNDKLWQNFNVPTGCTTLKIVLYLHTYTTDSLNVPYDKLYGSLQPVNSVSNPEVFIASNKKTCECTWRRMTYIYNQIPNPGQPLRLYLHATTDSSLYTNFFVDLVSVEASGTPFPQPATTADVQTFGDGQNLFWIEPVTGELPFAIPDEMNAKQ